MIRRLAPRVLMGLVLVGAVVLLPLSQVTDTGAERFVKDKLGITEEPCGETTPSPS